MRFARNEGREVMADNPTCGVPSLAGKQVRPIAGMNELPGAHVMKPLWKPAHT
jgi:hypothetical protein